MILFYSEIENFGLHFSIMYEYVCSHSFFIADSYKDFLFAVKNFDIKLFKLNKKI